MTKSGVQLPSKSAAARTCQPVTFMPQLGHVYPKSAILLSVYEYMFKV
jgi:hypothetical protein